MTTHKLSTGSYISYSVDDEFIIEDIKSFCKGDGTKLAKWAIAHAQANYPTLAITLCAYPTDATIDEDNLIEFWESVGFEKDAEQGGDGTLMTY